jgi:hypothetical protein
VSEYAGEGARATPACSVQAPNLSAARALAASSSRFFGRALVSSDSQQTIRDGGYFLDCSLKYLLVRLRRFVETSDFSHELQRSRANLLLRDWRIEVEKRFDVAAHCITSARSVKGHENSAALCCFILIIFRVSWNPHPHSISPENPRAEPG